MESVMCVLFIFSLVFFLNMSGTSVQFLYWVVVKLWVIRFNYLHLVTERSDL